MLFIYSAYTLLYIFIYRILCTYYYMLSLCTGIPWTSHPSSSQQVLTRTLDAAIRLIGSLFPFQSKEHIDKLIQLCTVSYTQTTMNSNSNGAGKATTVSNSSSNLSMFSAYDDEKKKKEYKACVIQKNMVAIMAAVVLNYPFEKIISDLTLDATSVNVTHATSAGGATSAAVPMPFSWCDSFTEWLLDSINQSNLEVKHISAVCLTKLAGGLHSVYTISNTINNNNNSNSNSSTTLSVVSPIDKLFGTVSSRLNSQMMTVNNNRVSDPINRLDVPGTGLLLTLGLSWAQAGGSPTTQTNILVVNLPLTMMLLFFIYCCLSIHMYTTMHYYMYYYISYTHACIHYICMY